MTKSCHNCGCLWSEAKRLHSKELTESCLRARCEGCHTLSEYTNQVGWEDRWYPRDTLPVDDPERLS
jgi:hypothetical protein